jgi:hypothetical protein
MKVKFNQAKRFNMASIRETAGIYGPGPAYFIQKLETIDSTKKAAARPFFPTQQRWKDRHLEEQGHMPSPASYNLPPPQKPRKLSPFMLKTKESMEKLNVSKEIQPLKT